MTDSMQLPFINLRAMEPEDLDLLYRVENDKKLWDVGSTNVPYSRYALHEYIANSSGDIFSDKQVRLIVENEERNTVGIVDLANFDPRHNRAEVGIVIELPYRRRHYALAALHKLHEYARNVLHIHQLYAIVAISNEPTRSLFNKMDYKQSLILTDWLFDGSRYDDACLLQVIL